MREIGQGLNGTKERVKGLIGMPMLIKVNSGRGKSALYHGRVRDVFPSIFTITLDSGENKTFSYADVHTGNILFLQEKD